MARHGRSFPQHVLIGQRIVGGANTFSDSVTEAATAADTVAATAVFAASVSEAATAADAPSATAVLDTTEA
jgi:hypothetical protein